MTANNREPMHSSLSLQDASVRWRRRMKITCPQSTSSQGQLRHNQGKMAHKSSDLS
jgi:hypothetical protein